MVSSLLWCLPSLEIANNNCVLIKTSVQAGPLLAACIRQQHFGKSMALGLLVRQTICSLIFDCTKTDVNLIQRPRYHVLAWKSLGVGLRVV